MPDKGKQLVHIHEKLQSLAATEKKEEEGEPASQVSASKPAAELTPRSEDNETSRQPPDALNRLLPENNEGGISAPAAGNQNLPNGEAFILADGSAEEFADAEIPQPAKIGRAHV